MHTRLMTLREVAQYLQVHTGTVYRLVKAGHLRAARIGRDFRFDIRELDDWISKGGTSVSNPPAARVRNSSKPSGTQKK